PDLVDFCVRYCDAAIGPVEEPVQATDETEAVAHAVNHDEPARADATSERSGSVGGRWIGDVQRFVIRAARIAVIQHVPAFGRTTVTFLLLVAKRTAPQRD